ncbi:MAG: lysine biosynthesis protein LysX [Candidatus Komeilibacteria bacterium]|nr:lysine biosynthesis protein LysX [Candidatus Komeilibacteria bacterium]
MTSQYKIGLLHTGIREDERMILDQSKARGVAIEPIDIRSTIFSPQSFAQFQPYDLFLQRCASGAKADQVLRYFTEYGKPIVNNLELSELCKNKYATSLRLARAGVPTPDFALAFTEDKVLEAIDQLGGFPVVIKPVAGTSWGRLMGKLTDVHAVEMILEHKEALGVNHQSFYLQKFIDKPGRDIRVYTVNGQTYAGIYRSAAHWITNTARGAEAVPCPITKEISEICAAAQQAVGNGLLALDLFETADGLMVNEINHTMEFKNVVKITGIDIPGKILDYCLEEIKNHESTK